MRRFKLLRKQDISGVSGTGYVAEGVLFSNGKATLSWLTTYQSVAVYDSLEILEQIHSHSGATVIEWVDKE